MDEKLKEISRKYDILCSKMEDPSSYDDMQEYVKLAREQKELEPLMEAYRKLLAAQNSREEAESLLDSEKDPELRELAKEELHALETGIPELENNIRILLLPKDPNDEKNVIMEIRAGVGGEESALFAADLYRMYSMYAEAKGYKVEIASINETDIGGFKEIIFIISGAGAYSRFKFESGVHRVQRVPETEVQGRVHTSTATVAVLPQLEEVEYNLNLDEVKIDVFRSSGAGGQKVNKTSSAIRVTHLPSGMVVECQDERSQYKNKDRALAILASRLYEIERQKRENEVGAERRGQVGSGMRNERIRTYNFPQNRLTDHRIGLTLYRLDSIINGDLEELIDALITADRAAQLAENK